MPLGNGGKHMSIKEQVRKPPDDDTAEEIIGILTAISVVSKRLAKRLVALQKPTEETLEGGADDAQDDEAR